MVNLAGMKRFCCWVMMVALMTQVQAVEYSVDLEELRTNASLNAKVLSGVLINQPFSVTFTPAEHSVYSIFFTPAPGYEIVSGGDITVSNGGRGVKPKWGSYKDHHPARFEQLPSGKYTIKFSTTMPCFFPAGTTVTVPLLMRKVERKEGKTRESKTNGGDSSAIRCITLKEGQVLVGASIESKTGNEAARLGHKLGSCTIL